MTTLDLDSTEIKRIDLSNGEPFAIIIKTDDMDESTMGSLQKSLRDQYADRFTGKVALFVVPSDSDVDYVTLKEVLEKLKES